MRIIKQSLFLLIVTFLISCSLNSEYLPEEFFGLQLTKKITGEEATKMVNKLHHEPVTEVENEIGHYSGDNKRALIYISHYQKPEDAKKYYDKMTKKISLGESPFTGSENIDISGKNIYRTFGMGQSHYIFTYNKELFWISVGTLYGKNFIEEYLSYLSNM
jgi:hypothetical protein